MAVRGLTQPIYVDLKHLPSKVESDGVEKLKRRTIIGRRGVTQTRLSDLSCFSAIGHFRFVGHRSLTGTFRRKSNSPLVAFDRALKVVPNSKCWSNPERRSERSVRVSGDFRRVSRFRSRDAVPKAVAA